MDAPTAGVLKDLTLLVWLALLAGTAAYKWLRLTRPSECWNWAGRVNARPYISTDAVVVAAISMLLLAALAQPEPAAPAGEQPAGAAPMVLSVPVVFAGILVQLITAALLLFYLGGVRGLSPAGLFGLRGEGLLRALGAALLFILPTILVINAAAWGVSQWLDAFWPGMKVQDSVLAFKESKDPAARGALVLAAVVIAPLVEELTFRGFVYGVIKRYTDGFFAALCSSLLFAVVHCHIGSLFPLALLALILCAAYELTGSLLTPMLMHALFNLTSLLLLVLAPEAPAP